MTDEEILAGFRTLSHQLNGTRHALMLVIRAIQAQPNFDHPAFVRQLALSQVIDEQKETLAPEFDSAVQRTLELFATHSTPLPPLPGGGSPPRTPPAD